MSSTSPRKSGLVSITNTIDTARFSCEAGVDTTAQLV